MRPAHQWRGPCLRASRRAASQLSTRGLTALLLRDRLLVDIVHDHRSANSAEPSRRESFIEGIRAWVSGQISVGSVSGHYETNRAAGVCGRCRAQDSGYFSVGSASGYHAHESLQLIIRTLCGWRRPTQEPVGSQHS
jgi:hypothetical protein